MKSKTVLGGVFLLLLLLAFGCDNGTQQQERATLRLMLHSDHFANQRALTPSLSSMEIASYHIHGTGPQGQSIDIDSAQTAVAIGNLAIGTWNLHAKAFNSEGIPLVEGQVETLLSKVSPAATLTLSSLVGTGNLDIQIHWDTEQVASDVRLEVTLLDQEGSACTIPTPLLDKEAGTASFQTPLAAGSYLMQLRLFSQEVLVSGATQAIRILDQTTADATIGMVIGDLSTKFELVLTNNTTLPIEGTITCSPASPAPQENVTLTYTPTNLDAELTVSDLVIDWYCEGELVGSDSRTLCTIPDAGTHRYDVIAHHEKLGSLGSSTLLVTMPYAP